MTDSKLTYYKDIESRQVSWLWYPYIPFGKITIVQGDPGEGKTTFILSLLSIISQGNCLPCSATSISGNAIYQNTEDDNADTIKPRLEKHGADCSKICFIDKPSGLSLDDDDLLNSIVTCNAKILVLDPIQAFVGESIDMNRANAVRPRMNKLKEIAEQTGCAIVLVGHLNKNSGGKANYRGLGSIDFSAAARSILLIGRSPTDETVRILAHQKSNLAPIGPSLAFTLQDGIVEWIGKRNISADELMNSSTQDRTYNKQEDAADILKRLLINGPVSASDIIESAELQDIGKRTILRAKAALNIESFKKKSEWYWRLPDE